MVEISQPKANATSNPNPLITSSALRSPSLYLSLSLNEAIQKNKFQKLQINSSTNSFFPIVILFQSSLGIMLHNLPKIHPVSFTHVL